VSGKGEPSSDRRWRLERIVVVAMRNPRQYIFVVSAAVAGLLSTLEAYQDVEDALTDLPFIVSSDWLNYIIVAGVIL
jgi:hypothetical protein